jgi:SAM-dependent methyltransferase
MPVHPESTLYRCVSCTHAFGLPRVHENYGSEYYDITHRLWFEHPNFQLFERIAKRIPLNSTVLDVGCGRGHFLTHLRRIRPDLTLTGIDYNSNDSSNGITFLSGDVMTVDPGTFAFVVSLAVIEHIPEVVEFVRRVRSFTRPGGEAAIMTLNDSSLLYRMARATRPVLPIAFNRLYSAHHLHHFTRRSLEELIESNGFSMEESWTHNAPLAAIDIPAEGLYGGVLRGGMWVVCRVGELQDSAYLQTVISKAR